MVADQFPDIQGTSSKLDGTLLSQHSDHLCKEFDGMTEPRGGYRTHSAPCYILPNQTATGLDYFSLDVLLRAAGTSLEAINYAGQTYRETGMLIQLRITYANFRNWHGSGPIFYYYEPHVVKHSTYKAYDSVYSGPATDYRSGRTLIDKHGVQLISIQGGSVRKFDFLNLLIVLTTSLTLLAVRGPASEARGLSASESATRPEACDGRFRRSTSQPRRHRGSRTRNIHVAAAASPRLASTK